MFFSVLNLIQSLINNKTYGEKKTFMVFLEMDMIRIYLFVVHQVVLESRNDDILNEEKVDRKKITLTLEVFLGRFGS